MKKLTYLLFMFFACSFSAYSIDLPLAFPGAEGYGSLTTGGRGGEVIIVTNLNDAGTGSLRAAIEASGPRIVVFEVSGIIELQSGLTIRNNDITIAGQTAPGDGICLKNYQFTVSADNVIIRYIRSRLGDDEGQESDAMGGTDNSNIIIDHCSLSWSVDETVSFYGNKNFTMQWCMVTESLANSIHSKGHHGYGGIWGGEGASFHHNLLAHHSSRNPRFCGSRYTNTPELEKIDHRNNVIYNWGGNSCYGAEGGSYNIVNNYYKPGKGTSSGVSDRIISPDPDNGSNSQPEGVWGEFYVDGNYIHGKTATTANNWNGVDFSGVSTSEIKLNAPFSTSFYAIEDQDAHVAYARVLADAGCRLPSRDTIDKRIAEEVRTGTYSYTGAVGEGFIDKPEDVGGYPTYNTTPPPTDTDRDGMPDDWEDANGLDKNDASDAVGTTVSGSHYTNIEAYVNSLVENNPTVAGPPLLVVTGVSGEDVSLAWKDASDNETGFILERRHADSTMWDIVDTVDADMISYTDTTVHIYGAIKYQIKAFKDTISSFYSNVASADVVNTGFSLSDVDGAKVNVYPNPFNEQTKIKVNLDNTTKLSIRLYDITGKEVMVLENSTKHAGEYYYSISDNNLQSGMYLLNVSVNNSVKVTRVVKH